MPATDKWFPEQAFGKAADPRLLIPLKTQQQAIGYLNSIVKDSYSARMLLGGPSSGKSTIVRGFLAKLRGDMIVAEIDGAGLTAEAFLLSILRQFGYNVDLHSPDDLLRILIVIAVQQTRTQQPPLIVAEDIERMQPAALRALCVLANVSYRGRYALRIVVTGDSKAQQMLGSKGMAALFRRIESVYEVEPTSSLESRFLLHGRLKAFNVPEPDSILPPSVCERIHELAKGNPGRLNTIARGTLQQALALPASVADVGRYERYIAKTRARPDLIVSFDGQVLETIRLEGHQVTIGLSSLADIVIHNDEASHFHALLLPYADALVLVDLNSTKGTFVNAARVSSTILKSDDIISLASHRIRVLNAPAPGADRDDRNLATECFRLKALDATREQRRAHLSSSITAKQI